MSSTNLLVTFVNLHDPSTTVPVTKIKGEVVKTIPATKGQRVGVLSLATYGGGVYALSAAIASKNDLPKYNKTTAQAKAKGRLLAVSDSYRFLFNPEDDAHWVDHAVQFLRERFGTTFLTYFPKNKGSARQYIRGRLEALLASHTRAIAIDQKRQLATVVAE